MATCRVKPPSWLSHFIAKRNWVNSQEAIFRNKNTVIYLMPLVFFCSLRAECQRVVKDLINFFLNPTYEVATFFP